MRKIRLWVDDERPMPDTFTHHVSTVSEALNVLLSQTVEHISLDHDLGPPEAGNGYEIASWIERKAYMNTLRPLTWKVHSANPVGRERMIAALKNADRYWNNRA